MFVFQNKLDDNFSDNSSTSCVGCLCGVTMVCSVNGIFKRHLNVVGWGLGFFWSYVFHVVLVGHSIYITISWICKINKIIDKLKFIIWWIWILCNVQQDWIRPFSRLQFWTCDTNLNFKWEWMNEWMNESFIILLSKFYFL